MQRLIPHLLVGVALLVAGCDTADQGSAASISTEQTTASSADPLHVSAQPVFGYSRDERATLRFATMEEYEAAIAEAEGSARAGKTLSVPDLLRDAEPYLDVYPVAARSLMDDEGRVVIGENTYQTHIVDGRLVTEVTDSRTGASVNRFVVDQPGPTMATRARAALAGISPEQIQSGSLPGSAARSINPSGQERYEYGSIFTKVGSDGGTYSMITVMAHEAYTNYLGQRQARAETEALYWRANDWQDAPSSLFPSMEVRAMPRAPRSRTECTFLIGINYPGGNDYLYAVSIGIRGTGYGLSYSHHSVSTGTLTAPAPNTLPGGAPPIIHEYSRLEGQETLCDNNIPITGGPNNPFVVIR